MPLIPLLAQPPMPAHRDLAGRPGAPPRHSRRRETEGGSVRPWVPAVVLALLVVLAGAVWWYSTRSTPERTLAGFHQALLAHDRTRARGFLTSESAKVASDPLLALVERSARADAPPRVVKQQPSGDALVVTMEGGFSFGPAGVGRELVLRREEGRWTIDLVGSVARALRSLPGMAATRIEPLLRGNRGAFVKRLGLRPLLERALDRAREQQ